MSRATRLWPTTIPHAATDGEEEHYAFLSLYRRRKPVSETERQLMQALMQHLTDAHYRNWKNELLTQHQRTDQNPMASCICDEHGLILSCDDHFSILMQGEWPQWQGPYLPNVLSETRLLNKVHRGRRIRVEQQQNGDYFLGRLSSRQHLAELTERERQTAYAFAAGSTHKVVAKEMEISPTTVRHYLRNMYAKLHIRNKAELVRALHRKA